MRSLLKPTVSTATIAALGIAALASLGAWRLQTMAADALAEAQEIQQREVPESDSAPPSPEENLRIIDTLTESIAIRREIDGLLARIEADVRFLAARQEESAQISGTATTELERIGRSLSTSVDASRTSAARLGNLDAALSRSVRLARLIAEELEELDRKLGPGAGGPGGPR